MGKHANKPRVVITYGTFDLMHGGHVRLLKRAKELGDYLIVGVTSDNYDLQRGKLNVKQSLSERIKAVEATGLADMVIIEEYEGQKVEDIQRYNVDVFAIGSDWKGKFDYLSEFCEVVYLDRTKGISSTQLRGVVRIGIVGSGRIARRFVSEAKFVSGVEVDWVFNPNLSSANRFASEMELGYATDDWSKFIDGVDAVYIASPHSTHFHYARNALTAGRHALVEKPMALSVDEAARLFQIAQENGLVLLEAIKTAFAPAFRRILGLAMSNVVGKVRYIESTFTKLVNQGRELDPRQAGGSFTELGSYVLLPFVKLCGESDVSVHFRSMRDGPSGVDLWTQALLKSRDCWGTATVGLGVKSEGDLVIGGTDGYIYVPAPWWKPSRFEIRREDPARNEHYCDVFAGDGLRYEIAHFTQLIQNGHVSSHVLSHRDSLSIARVIERFRSDENVDWITQNVETLPPR